MKLDAVKLLISKYLRNNDESGDEFNLPQTEENELYSSVFKRKIVMGVINQCDADANGELDTNEIFKLSLKLSSFEEFLGVSFDGFLDTVDSDVDWEEMSQEVLTNEEVKIQEYQQKTDFANFVLSTDSNITKEQFKKSVDLDIEIDENLVLINELMENEANLSDDQKETLNKLLAERKELLTSRDELEKLMMESGDEKTVQAIKEMQEARAELDKNQLENIDDLTAMQEQYGVVPPEEMQQSSSGGGGGSNYNGTNSTNKTENADVENKTKEQLEADLAKEEENLTAQQASLHGIIEGSDPEVSATKKTMDDAYTQYQELLKEVSPELAQRVDETKAELETAQQNYDTNQVNITNISACLTAYQANMDYIDSNIAAYQAALDSLNATDTTNLSEEQKKDIETRKQELAADLKKAQDDKLLLQAEIDKLTAQLQTFTDNVEPLAQALATAQDNFDLAQAEVDKLENETITAAKTAFTDAQKAYNDKKDSQIKLYSDNVNKSAENIKTIEAQIALLDKQEIEAKGVVGSNGYTVQLNGQNYDCVVPPEKVEELLQLINDTKANNKGDHYDMCLAFAIWYGQYLEGKASASEFQQFLEPGNIPYGNGSISTSAYDSDDKNEVLSRVEADIKNGHPAIIQVGASNNTSRHYVLVLGLRAGASSPPKEDDLIIIDTYDGKLEGMGQYGSRDMITGKQCKKKYSGYQMYHFNI